MNVTFIGYRCSGKSTISNKLQNMIGWKRVEIDQEIERYFQTNIPNIILQYGWRRFRKVEKMLIKKYSQMDRMILDLGGGAILDSQNMKNITKNSMVIFLDCPRDEIVNRLKKSFYRPPLTELSLEEETNQVLTKRMPLYRKYSNYRLKTAKMSIDQCVNMSIYFIRDYKLSQTKKYSTFQQLSMAHT